MDILSFASAVRCLSRVLERETKAAAPVAAAEPVKPRAGMTRDQKNLALISKIRVQSG